MARLYTEADLDFGKIDAALAKLAGQSKMTRTDVLIRLRDRLLEQQGKAVTVAQMCEAVNALWIDIREPSFANISEQGYASGADKRVSTEEGSDPF